MSERTERVLGINGLGRIGKLTLWHHVGRRSFDRIVVNVGRRVGRGLDAVRGVIEKDSTYGRIHHFLFGIGAEPCVRVVDEAAGELEVAGVPVKVLREARNPREIGWRQHGVELVVDTTGVFGDPTRPADHPKGSLRGHLEGGARCVINSAAFKIKDPAAAMPEDAATLIYGINHDAFDPERHRLVSAASCTTTALAHMVRPLLEELHVSTVMTASMSTVHAVTNSQKVLDTVPKTDAKDLRRNRSVLNSIILTSTNAARALERVIPEIREIGFMADSVRIPVPTTSLIILNVTFQDRRGEDGTVSIQRDTLNDIYRRAAAGAQRGLLVCSEEQNTSADFRGPRAAVVIETVETHTRTGFVNVDLKQIPGFGPLARELEDPVVHVPVTHAKIFGWYDNEYGSYTAMLGELTEHVARALA